MYNAMMNTKGLEFARKVIAVILGAQALMLVICILFIIFC